MKATQFASFGIIPAALFIAACGDDVTKVTKIEETSGMEVVASADSLGKCTAEISGEMKFATKENAVYVCADSAWKNVSKTEKTTCSAEALSDSSGFKIVCDGDSVGVVKNGANGTDGEKGEAGKDGASGESCKLVDGPVREAGSSLVQTSFVVCGKDTVGTISDGRPGENCELADGGDGTVSVVCGETSTTLYKAFCGGTLFNPDSSFCVADSIVPLCGGKSYDLNENFCFADSIVPLCDGKIYDLDSSFCVENLIVPQSKKLVWDLMNPEIEYGVFVDDRDGQVYRSVKIGEQVWMAKNLNYAVDSSYCYEDSLENCQKYGRLYATRDIAKSACPAGWHLPDNSEFKSLIASADGRDLASGDDNMAGKALKSKSGWRNMNNGNDGNGTDSWGFSALPAGYKTVSSFFNMKLSAKFWSSTGQKGDDYYLNITYSSDEGSLWVSIFSAQDNLSDSYSVRCVRD